MGAAMLEPGAKRRDRPRIITARRASPLIRRVWLGVGLAILAFAGVTAWGKWTDHDRAVDDAFALTSNVAQALDQEMRRLVASVDMVLAAAAIRVDAHAGGAAVANTRTLLDGLLARVPAVTGLRVLDGSTGSTLYALGRDGGEDEALVRGLTGEPRPGEAGRGDPATGGGPAPGGDLVVGTPVRDGAGGWSVAVARRTLPRAGETPLVAVADLSLRELQSLYGTFRLGPLGSVFLVRSDGTLLVRHPYIARGVGRIFPIVDMGLSQEGTARRGLAPSGTADGVPRLLSARRLDPLPLVVGVTLARDDALAAWRRDVTESAATVAAVAIVLLGFGFGLTRAIARRERLEAETRATARHLAATLETMDQGLVVLGPDGPPLSNRHAAALLGPALGAIDLAAARAEVGRRAERAGADGRVLEVCTAAMADGGVVQTFTDVTERRRAEAQLTESEALYRLVAENATDVILRADAQGRIEYVSPAILAVTGLSPADIIGHRGVDLAHPDDRARLRRAFRVLIAAGPGGPPIRVEYRVRHRDGRLIWFESGPRIVFGPDGRPRGWTDVVRDVTERKGLETALASAKEAAERASAAKSDFLASMSHEIRTPLNGVLGYADLLIEEPGLSPRQRAHARHIQAAGSALLTVLDDVLDFSAIEAGRVVLQPRPFAPAALAEEACAIVRGLAERKGLALEARVEPGLPGELVGDPDRLRQVLLNLLNNAVKFTARGRVILTLAPADLPETDLPETDLPETGLPETEPPGRPCGLRVSVSDTGIGIAPEKRDRLFQRFSQLDGSIRREFGGTGLGLAISQRLVGLMGGTIGVESAPGAGSTFGFVLALPEAGPALAAAGSSGVVGPGRAARVLLVEDLAINQELARAVLEGVGHAVDVVGDGSAAVAAVRSRTYDVVLMDVQMPGLDGLSATRAIRGLGGAAGRVPIVAMTANVLPEQLAAYRAAGMDGHVGKPFRRQQLLDAVARWADPSRDGRDDPHRDGPDPAMKASEAMLDRAIHAELVTVVGPDVLAGLMDQLAADLAGRFAAVGDGTEDRARLAADAHALVSTAGMLGFTPLARLCVAFEQSCRAGEPLEPRLQEIRYASAAVIAEVVGLRDAA